MTKDLIIGILLTLNSCMTFYVISRLDDPVVVQCANVPYYELVETESLGSCTTSGLKQK